MWSNKEMNSDIFFMQRCLELAVMGSENVAPNPMVGAVLVYDNKIIGEGYHEEYGKAHAEVNAIHSVKNKELLKKATLYVSLEPCNHYGKTPPCSRLIVEHKIPKVVIACMDPFSEVAGKGIETLKSNGVEVVMGVLEAEALLLNKRFFTFHTKKRPYIILKWAQTDDSFIDIERNEGMTDTIHWITQPETQQLTHRWRAEESAILVGKNTVINDNPSLTTRAVIGKNPIRLLVDKNLELDPLKYKVFDSSSSTHVFNDRKDTIEHNIHYIKFDFDRSVPNQIAEYCFRNNWLSLLIEGGAYTLNSFIIENLWDEARVLTGNKLFNVGISAPTLPLAPSEAIIFGQDQIAIYFND